MSYPPETELPVDETILAFGQFLEHHTLKLLCGPRQHRDAAVRFSHERFVEAVDRRHTTALELSVWHDVVLEADAAFGARRRSERPFPVTMGAPPLPQAVRRAVPLLLARPERYDAIICRSNTERDAMATILTLAAEELQRAHGIDLPYRGRLETIATAVDTARWRPLDRASCRRHFGLDEDAFVIVWHAEKGEADLLPFLEVVRELLVAKPKLRVVYADDAAAPSGDVVMRLAQQLGVGEQVRIVARSDWPVHLLGSADVFVGTSGSCHPSEAMACGVPQIVVDWGGHREIVVDGETGFTIPTLGLREHRDLSRAPEDAAWSFASSVTFDRRGLRDALQKLIADPELVQTMSTASRRRAEAAFAWPVIAAHHESLWHALEQEAGEVAVDTGAACGPTAYGAALSGYPSRCLEDDDLMRLSTRGREAMSTQTMSIMMPSVVTLDPELLKRAMVGLRHFDTKGEALAVGRVIGVLLRNQAMSDELRDHVRRHLLWLIRSGLAELSPPIPGD